MSSKSMETKNKMLEPLKHIQKVAPASDLFSKIENRINEEQLNKMSLGKLMAACAVIIILIASNSFIINKELKTNKSSSDLTETFGINTSNQLYHE